MAALRDRLPAARRDREGASAGRSSPPTCRGGSPSDVAKRRSPASTRCPRPIGRCWRADLQCPHDAYFDRFAEPMGDHSPSDGAAVGPRRRAARHDRAVLLGAVRQGRDDGRVDRAGVREARAGRPGPVVHVNGAFHSDFGAGTPSACGAGCRAAASRSSRCCRSSDLDTLAPAGDDLKRADYLVYTVKYDVGSSSQVWRLNWVELPASWNHALSSSTPIRPEPLFQPLRHIRDHIGHHRDRGRGARHVHRVDLVDGVGRRVVDQEVVRRRTSSDIAGMFAAWTLGPMSAPPPLAADRDRRRCRAAASRSP